MRPYHEAADNINQWLPKAASIVFEIANQLQITPLHECEK